MVSIKILLLSFSMGVYIFIRAINLELIVWCSEILLDLIQTPLENLSEFDQDMAKEAKLEATKLIQFYGYPAENHTVLTKDGYILKLHRIPFGKHNKTGGGYPVLLQHGVVCGSRQWVNSKEESLGFILANIGYDVWLGNFRGNCHSKYHIRLKRSNAEFWKFGGDKLAKYDIPSMIQYIRFITGFDKVLTIGHSLGFAAIASAIAINPSLNFKIKGIIGLAPIARTRYSFSHLRNFQIPWKLIEYTSTKSYFGHSKLTADVIFRLCPNSNKYFCCNIVSLFNGLNPEACDEPRIPIFLHHCTCGNSIHIIYHWFQVLSSKTILGYDYGKEDNMKEYGQPTPNAYNFSKIKVPVALLSTISDGLSSLIEKSILLREIPTVVESKVLPGIFLSHVDFFLSQRNTTSDTVVKWLPKIIEY